MLTIHHLGKSQSERIIWLCEELGLPYQLQHYQRDTVTMLAPPELARLHPLGAAPVITEGELVLAESGAIMQYLLARHDNQGLALAPTDPAFADYLYWLNFANGNLQPNMGRSMLLRKLDLATDNPVLAAQNGRLGRVLDLVEIRLGSNDYLAGSAFSAADIMLVFSLTTMRIFLPYTLSPYPRILAYLQRIGARAAYQRAMHRGDPGMVPMLT
ncbi:glutathione S-transferase family protein [Actimicrobium sp. CCC2.4]|uniref:glutathione S-transferase family protein n=1 Tax=Actimicrobium sp. CCC2.4 TaxID=3048606 RepID=UPI002AC8F1E2|nr:glutathione S-transferase family protein [Actimicrobium sp. CCC2.4]MEB0136405.1 glutathione S-transferase family protein [Actimicrobium sp. CCC2.4]WPX31224.1 glutathione S-transferase family protein [Actimicrobium sp. CCC2.4]